MRSTIIFYCPLYCATLPYAIFTIYAFDTNIAGPTKADFLLDMLYEQQLSLAII